MLKDNLLFIKALLRFLVAVLGVLYRGAKVVQYAFMGWLVHFAFRKMTTAAIAEEPRDDTPWLYSVDYARRTAPQYEAEGVYLS